jgi:integrase
MPSSGDSRRVRVERGIYQQPNGKYAVCVRVDGRGAFARSKRRHSSRQCSSANSSRAPANSASCRSHPGSPSPRSRAAGRWRWSCERQRSSVRSRPRLGNRRLALITTENVVAVARELQADGLSPWTVKRILGALSCVFTFALRRGYVNSPPFDRLEPDERPHPLRSDQRVLTQTELTRLFAACPRRYRPLLLTGAFTGMRLSEVLALGWDDVDFSAGVIHTFATSLRAAATASRRTASHRRRAPPSARSRSSPNSRRFSGNTNAAPASRAAPITCSRLRTAPRFSTTTSPSACCAAPPAARDSIGRAGASASMTCATPSPVT